MTTDLIEYCKNLIASMFEWSASKIVCTASLTPIVYLLGDGQEAFAILLVLILLDLMMALIVVAKTEVRFESAKLRHSAIKTLVYFCSVAGGIQVDRILNLPHMSLLPDEPIAKLILVTLASTELLSMLEHASQLGFVIPVKLLRNIKKVRDGVK